MKSHTEYLTFNVRQRMEFVNITRQVEAAVTKSGIEEGLVLCNTTGIALPLPFHLLEQRPGF